MAAWGRLFRLSTVSFAAAGGVLKISKELGDKTTESNRNPNLELVLVQIAFRHGARTPIFRPPCQELEEVMWPTDLVIGALPHTAVNYELKHVSGGPSPCSESKERMLKKLLKVSDRLFLKTFEGADVTENYLILKNRSKYEWTLKLFEGAEERGCHAPFVHFNFRTIKKN